MAINQHLVLHNSELEIYQTKFYLYGLYKRSLNQEKRCEPERQRSIAIGLEWETKFFYKNNYMIQFASINIKKAS